MVYTFESLHLYISFLISSLQQAISKFIFTSEKNSRLSMSLQHTETTILALIVFSTSDFLNQMCYCCQKLDFQVKFAQFGRPWEAMGGRAPLIGSLIWSDLCYPIREHGLPRPPTHTASHILSCDLSEPIYQMCHKSLISCFLVGGRSRDTVGIFKWYQETMKRISCKNSR